MLLGDTEPIPLSTAATGSSRSWPAYLAVAALLAICGGVVLLSVSDLTLDSRTVSEGCLFLAQAGLRSHGLEHAAQRHHECLEAARLARPRSRAEPAQEER